MSSLLSLTDFNNAGAVVSDDPVMLSSIEDRREQFNTDGFVIIEQLIQKRLVDLLNAQLECVLRGQYNIAGGRPDKAPKFNDQRRKPGKLVPPI
ncbi:MAG: hypothetical protein SGPRY_010606, partial [Prymnesium sp.]